MEQQLVGLPFSLVISEQMVFVGREIEFRCKKKKKTTTKSWRVVCIEIYFNEFGC